MTRRRTLLLAASLAASSALRLGAQRPLGRRAAFSSFGGALLAPQVGRVAFSGALGGTLLTPQIAKALDPTKDRPNDSLLLILRVKEAAAQETRLIKSGKFKDLQRNSIKLAISLMPVWKSNFGRPTPSRQCCLSSCICSMAWSFQAIDATLSPWPLDSVH